jgi:hypothetical protein
LYEVLTKSYLKIFKNKIMKYSLSMTSGRSMVFPGYSDFECWKWH